MMTDSAHSLATANNLRGSVVPTSAKTQKVAIVNGSPEILALVETVLTAGHYDVVFVESIAHAYSHIKRVQPDLVILCVHFDEIDALQVLSMLKLDEETRAIPVLTYTGAHDLQGQAEEEESEESDGGDISIFAPVPDVRMN